jgi:S1-C subfamily serine protease
MKIRQHAALFAAGGLFLGGGALVATRALAGDALDPLQALDRAVPRAAERAERSVVALVVEREEREDRDLTQREKMSLGLGALRLFDKRYFTRPPGACSGVVVKADKGAPAYVVTESWNVRDAKSVSLLLDDGTKVPVTQKGRDENLDLALLEVPHQETLAAIEVAPAPRVGQFAILVGRGGERASPIVSWGNVSALGRFRGDAIQVTTRMNYGNAGGAVVDLDGKLLGIATRLTDRAHQGLNSGVGFAAPVGRLVSELGDLVAGKVIARRKSPFLGIAAPTEAAKLPEGVERGVLIGQVLKGGAAEKAGLMSGDVIEIFHGVEVKDFLQLRDEIERLEVGEKVIVTVYRADKGEKDFTIELGARAEGEE